VRPLGGRRRADRPRREKIASYKMPQVIEFVTAIPKSPTGKVLEKELRGR
jgi:acyl-coenzyme A synthetase/AMP-(fatty) acid ligase